MKILTGLMVSNCFQSSCIVLVWYNYLFFNFISKLLNYTTMTVRQTTEQIVLEIITKGYSETFNALKTKYLSLKATAEEGFKK